MTHGSLFSGIGGFDLAAEWMGWDNIFHCEWNDFGKKVLKHYWPKSISYHDITKTDFTIHRGTIDILTGGFPCQPYSTAGKRLGKEDERHLWPEMLRAIREIEPTWIVGENVRGLVSWSGGLVFEEVCADLEAQGYSVQPFLLPAASVNAPHRRDRVWFVAHSNNERKCNGLGQVQAENGEISKWNDNDQLSDSDKFNAANTASERLEGSKWRSSARQGFAINSKYATDTHDKGLEGGENGRGSRESWGRANEQSARHVQSKWENFPTVTPICNGDDGLSNRLDSITFPKWRNESIKAGGNAIVPQVAYQIFKAIQNYENQTKLF